jgi:cell division protein FtsB
MYAPAPSDPQPSRRYKIHRKRRRQNSPLRRLAKHTRTLEMSARLVVNAVLIGVSVSTLAKLVPYLHHQAEQLQTLNAAVDQAEDSTSTLKADFSRYFDPWQTQNVAQEQSGYKSPTERQVVWTEPTWD